MKKIFYITLGLAFFITTETLFAASFTIDNLNLREVMMPVINPPAAYFKIGLEDTWNKINSNQTKSLSPVTIGIIDTGVDVTHPEFKGVNFGSTPKDAKIDHGEKVNGVLTSHGTNIAGIIGANNISETSSTNYVPPQMNGVLSGVKNLEYILINRWAPRNPLAVSPTLTSLFTISKQINEISEDNATLINISQEEGFFGRIAEFTSRVFSRNFSSHPDTLFVVAAGNGGRLVSGGLLGFDISPANLGNLPNVITVGATTIDDMRYTITQDGKTTGSNFGNEVSLSAPGDSVYSPTFYHSPLNVSDYESFSGTSASAPLVTGVAGLLKSINPNLTPAQIKQILIRTADTIETDQPIGGRLNAYNAVCDSEVGLNCETNEDPVAFFEGWESLSLGHPLCETLPPYTSGDVCAFTADGGKWVVSESVPIGSPISSVEILQGKILKLKPQTHYSNGFLSREIRTAGDMFIPITRTTAVSFTDFAVIPSNIPSRADFFVSFRKDGISVCPSTGENIFTTSIWYVLSDTTGIPPEEFPVPPCTARVFLSPSSSFARNFNDDFANLLPFSSEGWNVSDMMLQIVSLESPAQEVAVTWDNVTIMR
jgi:hypothetical protein